jgi:hypothetical protein
MVEGRAFDFFMFPFVLTLCVKTAASEPSEPSKNTYARLVWSVLAGNNYDDVQKSKDTSTLVNSSSSNNMALFTTSAASGASLMILDPLTRHDKSGQPIYILKPIFFFLLCFILVVGKLSFAQENAATAQLCEATTTAEAGQECQNHLSAVPLTHQKKKHNMSHWSSRLAPMAILDPAWLKIVTQRMSSPGDGSRLG